MRAMNGHVDRLLGVMTSASNRVNLLIADAARAPWSTRLAESLAVHPVDVHWTQTDTGAIDLAVSGRMHAAVLDYGLPPGGGLDALRSIRQLGLDLPCLLVCAQASPRLLEEALLLNVFSVVSAEGTADMLTPLVLKIMQRLHRSYGSSFERMN